MTDPLFVCVNVLTSGSSEKDKKPDPRGVSGFSGCVVYASSQSKKNAPQPVFPPKTPEDLEPGLDAQFI
jgi:hypothetical protein